MKITLWDVTPCSLVHSTWNVPHVRQSSTCTQNIGARRHIPEVDNIRLQIANKCQARKSVDGYKTGSE